MVHFFTILDPYGPLLHYTLITSIILITLMGISIGQSLIGQAAISAINVQPEARSDLQTMMLLGLSLIEITAILGTIIAGRMFINTSTIAPTLYVSLAECGVMTAMCLTSFILPIASSQIAKAALYAIARQPLIGKQITQLALLSLAIIQSPLVFAFLVSTAIQNQLATVTTLSGSLRLIAAGISIGCGAIGPIIGLAIIGYSACNAVGKNKNSYQPVMTSSLFGQAFAETGIAFVLTIALMMLFASRPDNFLYGFSCLSAALCIALSTIAAGISLSLITATVNQQIANNPSIYKELSTAGLLSMVWVEASVLFCFLVAIFIIFNS